MGRRIVVAGGFDPIHDGHIDHLEKAASLKKDDDVLIVILAREDQLRQKKNYFYQSFKTRYKIVIHLDMVDYVVANIDDDCSCADTLRWLKPQIFVKGGDRTPENMPQKEKDVCEEIGCKIVYGYGDLLNSSSKLVKDYEERINGNK
jgi:cytidyltransferase-like protein